MFRGSNTKVAVLCFSLLILSVLGLGGLSVSPDVVRENQDGQEFRVTVTNDAGDAADRATLLLPASDGTTPDLFGDFDPSDVHGTTGNWSVSALWSRDENVQNDDDTVAFSGDTLDTGESFSFNITLQTPNGRQTSWKANLSNGAEYGETVIVDDTAPNWSNRSPEGGNVTTTAPSIDIAYDDGQGIGVDTAGIRFLLNGQEVTSDASVGGEEASYDASDLPEGPNNVSVYLVDDFGNARWVNWTFSPAVKPLLDKRSPTGVLQDDGPEIEVRYRDPSPLDTSRTTITIDGEEHDSDDSAFSTETVDGDTWIRYDIPYSLDDGEHDVVVNATDDRGNSRRLSWTFVVDTTAPTIDSSSVSDGDIYREDMPVFIDASDAASGVDRVEIEVGDTSETVTEQVQGEYRGRIDTTELADGGHTVTVTVYDGAGNTHEEQYEITIDNDPPDITYTDLFPNPTNVAPTVEVVGEDTATEVIAAEYYIGDDPGEGEARPLDIEERDGRETRFSTTIDIEDLDNDVYEVDVRVKDSVQHWSEVKELGFELDRSLQASIAFMGLTPVRVRQGASGRTPVSIRNTGRVPGKVNLSIGSPYQAFVTHNNRIIRPGETRTFYVNASVPSDAELGNRTINLTARTESTMTTGSTTLVVEANQATRQQVEEQVTGIKEDLSTLRQRRDRWEKQLDPALVKNVSERVTKLQKTIDSIDTAIEEDNFRAAQRQASDLPAAIEDTSQELQQGVEEYRAAKERRTMILAVIALLVALGIVAWYRYRPPPEGFDGEEGGFISRPDDRHPIQVRGEELVERLRDRGTYLLDRLRLRLIDLDMSRTTEDEDEEGWKGYSPDT